ncbi:hypothetical protein JTF06_06810 [Desemzia sp. RIT804]|uniref:TraX family protein n=1 Tax=Desemzia sp. RIT 804 TaxID=2810209 RepID=UPI00194F9434|nr:TraX family protein [Desemzia sp. RIT 804]MBM6614597.1 hypothetical protein [Desemzia sp. RIT 804]
METISMQSHSFDEKSNLIKWLAIIIMTIDHIGAYLLPQFVMLRVIGRIAFPLFLYTTVLGAQRTRNFNRYLFQLVLFGIISIPVTLGRINILFSLALFALSMKDKRFFLPCLIASYFVEYGIYGFLLGWAIYILVFENRYLGILAYFLLHIPELGTIQIYAVLALIPILLPFRLHLIRVPKFLGYAYYPLHLAVIHFIARL